MDGGVWLATVHGVAKSQTRLSDFTFLSFLSLNKAWNLVKNTSNAGGPGSIPGSGRSPEVGNGNPLQYSCLENFMGRGIWWATIDGVAESQTQLSD